MSFFTEKKKVLRFKVKHRRSRIPSRKRKAAGITILNFKQYYRVALTKMYDNGTRTDTQNNRIGN